MSFTRARTQVLSRLMPGALFVHDDYGICQVVAVDLDSTEVVNDTALLDAVREYVGQWDAPLRAGYVLNLTLDLRRVYVVGVPTRVRFIPYPDLLQCVGCGRVAPLRRLRGGPPGVCPTCGAAMRQVRFMESHACGRLEPLTVPTCPIHGADDLMLEATGRYRALTWRCLACGNAFLATVQNRSCMCEVTKRNTQDRFFSRLMRGSIVTDSALHLVHTVAFLNLPSDAVDAILAAPDGRLLALARSCGALTTPVLVALHATTALGPTPVIADLLAALRTQGVNDTLLDAAMAQVQGQRTVITTVLETLEQIYGVPRDVLRGRVPRRVVEFAALLDSGAARALPIVRAELEAAGDTEGVVALDAGAVQVRGFGLSALYTLDAFPLAITAIGFSRLSRAPNMCASSPSRCRTSHGCRCTCWQTRPRRSAFSSTRRACWAGSCSTGWPRPTRATRWRRGPQSTRRCRGCSRTATRPSTTPRRRWRCGRCYIPSATRCSRPSR
ncbi:hypothetical protein EKD04_024740 [Chloroflexales bacterium ZM16-3]|nr:hypothetical protein [Chloroflexales bacterium ZM16-3]